MSANTILLQQCQGELQSCALGILQRCLDSAIAELQAKEDACRVIVERDRLGLAWRALARHTPQWLREWPQLLRSATELGSQHEATPSRPAPLAANAFTLMDSTATESSMESARLVQALLLATDGERATLDMLMSAVLGLESVRAERNPFRPEAFASAARSLFAAAAPAAETQALWLRHVTSPLGYELSALYARLVSLLKREGVQPAGYRLKLAVGGATGSPTGAPTGASNGKSTVATASGSDRAWPGARPHTPADGWPADDDVAPGYEAGAVGAAACAAMVASLPLPDWAGPHGEVPQEFLHQFLSGTESSFQHPLPASYFQQVDAQRHALEHAPAAPLWDDAAQAHTRTARRSLSVVERGHHDVGTGTPLSPQTWGAYAQPIARDRALMRHKRRAQDVAQVLGLEVVRTLVNQVGADARLLAPVREAVVALEPALLHMAMANPRFINQDQHPARCLVEGVAQRSFKFNDEFSSEFAQFLAPVQEAFKQLSGEPSSQPALFADALAQLQKVWLQQDEQDQAVQDDGLHSIRFAEQRQAMADEQAWELSKRADLKGVPALVLDFLYETWSLVLAHAKLTDTKNQIDPGGYYCAVSDLLWSVKKEVTLKRPARLIEVVPGLVRSLHSGLDLLGKDQEERAPFFDTLMRLHNPVLKLRRARIRQEAKASARDAQVLSSLALDLEDELVYAAAQPVPQAAAQPWLARSELDAAGFGDTQPSDYALLDSAAEAEVDAMPSAAHDAKSVAVDAAAVLAGLKEGAWVDLFSKRQWVRAQLIWASTKGTLFMFVSRGGQPHSMTKRSCERLVAQRLLRPVSTEAVVAHALRQVLKSQKLRPMPSQAAQLELA